MKCIPCLPHVLRTTKDFVKRDRARRKSNDEDETCEIPGRDGLARVFFAYVLPLFLFNILRLIPVIVRITVTVWWSCLSMRLDSWHALKWSWVMAIQNAPEEVFGAHLAEEQNRRRSFGSDCHCWLLSPFHWHFVLYCLLDGYRLLIFGSKSGALIIFWQPCDQPRPRYMVHHVTLDSRLKPIYKRNEACRVVQAARAIQSKGAYHWHDSLANFEIDSYSDFLKPWWKWKKGGPCEVYP